LKLPELGSFSGLRPSLMSKDVPYGRCAAPARSAMVRSPRLLDVSLSGWGALLTLAGA
jgi:hypothetical protein